MSIFKKNFRDVLFGTEENVDTETTDGRNEEAMFDEILNKVEEQSEKPTNQNEGKNFNENFSSTKEENSYENKTDNDFSNIGYSPEYDEPIKPKSTSLVDYDMNISGSVKTEGNLEIKGSVKGNITAEGDIVCSGDVVGNIVCEKIAIGEAVIKGDIKAEKGIVTDANSMIVGDVKTENILIGGKIKGDVKAKSTAIFDSNAKFLGDISAETFSMEKGAVVNGRFTTLTDGDVEEVFDIKKKKKKTSQTPQIAVN